MLLDDVRRAFEEAIGRRGSVRYPDDEPLAAGWAGEGAGGQVAGGEDRWPVWGRYRLHPLMREAMRAEVAADPERWSQLHRGAARAMAMLATWVNHVVGTSTERGLERWRAVRDVFDALDTSPWVERARGAGDVAHALVMVDQFRQLVWSTAARLRVLEEAVRMATDAPPAVRANVLKARGGLAVKEKDLERAWASYVEALKLYEAVEDALGMSNVLAEMARVHALAGQWDDARTAADEALTLAKRAHNAYARKLAEAILAAADKQQLRDQG